VLTKKRNRQERINKINDFVDENFGLDQKTPVRLLNLFCAGLFLFHLIGGLFDINVFKFFFNSKVTAYSFGVLVYLLQLLIIYLLYRRTHWGWVLFIAIHTILALLDLSRFLSFFAYLIPNILFNLSYHVAVIIFLNVKSIHEQFLLTKDKRITTLIVSGIIAAVIIFILA